MEVKIGKYKKNGGDRKIDIHIDNYDVWNADHTLALIILPLLKKLKDSKAGSPFTDDEDVPENIRSTNAKPKKNDWDTDEFHHARWSNVVDQMIWSFEQYLRDDRESQFYSGNIDYEFVPVSDTTSEMVKGPNDTFKVDRLSQKAYEDRIQNGINLFAKYYQCLWT